MQLVPESWQGSTQLPHAFTGLHITRCLQTYGDDTLHSSLAQHASVLQSLKLELLNVTGSQRKLQHRRHHLAPQLSAAPSPMQESLTSTAQLGTRCCYPGQHEALVHTTRRKLHALATPVV